MLSLTISHLIHLTRDQRYELHAGIDLQVIGVSIPVWYNNGETSEPAKEVFARYYLKNPRKELPIKILEDGYEIIIPARESRQAEVSDEDWLKLNKAGVLDEFYSKQITEISSKNLLDISDGGSQALIYREHNKVNRDEKLMNIMHYVTILDTENLNRSLVNLGTLA